MCAEPFQLEQREDHRLEQQGHQRQRHHSQHNAHKDRHPRQRPGQRHQLLPALPLADGLAHHDGGGCAQAEADHQEQPVQVAHNGVGRQELHGDDRVTQNDRQQAVAQTPEQLVHQHRGGVFHEAPQHLAAGTHQRLPIQRDDPAAQGADQADNKLRHAAKQRGDGCALHAQHGEAALAEDQQIVHAGVENGGHAEQLHAEAGILNAALGADVDGRQHVEHIGKADDPQVRRAQQGQVVLVAHEIHDLHRPEEQRHGHHQRQRHTQERRHADGAADALQVALAPVLADEDAHAGLHAEHDGNQQEHRHVGRRYRRHFVVAQLTDHQRVDQTQRKRDEILQGDG